MKSYDENIASSYLMYLDASNLYRWGMSQKLSINSFKWVKHVPKFNKDFIKIYNKNINKRYILKVDVEFPKSLFNLHKDLSFLYERKKILKNARSLIKQNYAVHIKALRQALNHGLILKTVHRVI